MKDELQEVLKPPLQSEIQRPLTLHPPDKSKFDNLMNWMNKGGSDISRLEL